MSQQLGPSCDRWRQVVEVASRLVQDRRRSAPVAQIRDALQDTGDKRSFSNWLCCWPRGGFELLRLAGQVAQVYLQFVALAGQAVQAALQVGDVAFRFAQPVGGVGPVFLAAGQFLAQDSMRRAILRGRLPCRRFPGRRRLAGRGSYTRRAVRPGSPAGRRQACRQREGRDGQRGGRRAEVMLPGPVTGTVN